MMHTLQDLSDANVWRQVEVPQNIISPPLSPKSPKAKGSAWLEIEANSKPPSETTESFFDVLMFSRNHEKPVSMTVSYECIGR